ncbi:unnamed protein product, partial [Adineta steineri]
QQTSSSFFDYSSLLLFNRLNLNEQSKETTKVTSLQSTEIVFSLGASLRKLWIVGLEVNI